MKAIPPSAVESSRTALENITSGSPQLLIQDERKATYASRKRPKAAAA